MDVFGEVFGDTFGEVFGGEPPLTFVLDVNVRLLIFLQDFYVADTELNPLLVQYLGAEATGEWTARLHQAIQDATDAMA